MKKRKTEVCNESSELTHELISFCQKWGGIEDGAKIESLKISASQNGICRINVKLFASKQVES